MRDFIPDHQRQIEALREEILRIEKLAYADVMSWPGLPAWVVARLKAKLEGRRIQ